jgi:hypothetical protein
MLEIPELRNTNCDASSELLGLPSVAALFRSSKSRGYVLAVNFVAVSGIIGDESIGFACAFCFLKPQDLAFGETIPPQ